MTAPALPPIDDADLADLEATLDRALSSGDASGLELLGYGEISCVVAWESGGARFAAKRLPTFGDARALGDYRSCFEGYLSNLRARGMSTLQSELREVTASDGRPAAWCLQPVVPTAALLPQRFRSAAADEHGGEDEIIAIFHRVLDHVLDTVDARLGLDGQLSNWCEIDGDLHYLDVTTPAMRDGSGRERLDTELFLAALPWAVRGMVRRRVRGDILDKYYEPRRVVLDFLGNLIKEDLEAQIELLLDHANARVDPPLELDEVRRYYRGDARTWSLLLRLRRADRFWQRKVRGRPYPFLLPGPIQR